MGLEQDAAYARYGRGHWEEGMFYLHFLALPGFVFVRGGLERQLHAVHAAGGGGARVGVAVGTGTVPWFYMPLGVNVATQVVCVAGVHRLTARVDSVGVALVLVVRKAVSLGVSAAGRARLLWTGGHTESRGGQKTWRLQFRCTEKHPVWADLLRSTPSRVPYGHDFSGCINSKTWRQQFHHTKKHSSCDLPSTLNNPSLTNLASALSKQSHPSSQVNATTWGTNSFVPEKHWYYSQHPVPIDLPLSNLATALTTRHEQSGQYEDLAAILCT
jgi:UAA transporter family